MFHKVRVQRMRNARTIRKLAVPLGAVVTLSLAACGGGGEGAASALDELKESGVIRIGVANSLPTAGPNTTPTGLVPELVEKVFTKLGVEKVVAVPMDYGALIPSLQSGRIDATATGFYATPERCKVITLAEPSYYYMDGMAVAKGNPHNIKTFDDIAKAGIDMGAVAGSATIGQAKEAGVKKSNIQQYTDRTTLLDALKAGRIDVAPYDNVSIKWELQKPAYSDLTATEPVAPIINGSPRPYTGSVGFTKEAGDIAEAFNKTQAEMFDNNEFDSLIKKWGQSKEMVRPANAPGIDEYCSE